ncbi:MAG TPA: hypothetical protein PK438_07520, partial [Clostridia bacterium]|nr:hypothetical protein [Clostridia bacterium]
MHVSLSCSLVLFCYYSTPQRGSSTCFFHSGTLAFGKKMGIIKMNRMGVVHMTDISSLLRRRAVVAALFSMCRRAGWRRKGTVDQEILEPPGIQRLAEQETL